MNLDERYFELWNSSKQDLCNHSLKLEQELAKAKEQLEEAVEVIEFYSHGYIVDQKTWKEDDDAECVNTWNLYTGKRARQFLAKYRGEK